MLENKLIERKLYHTSEKNKIPMNEIKHERLALVLKKANVPGDNFDEQNEKYEEALGLSLKKGYAVVLRRDIDELYTNTYNPEWIKSWNANMDMQICLDFFAVITYITDYYMKDDSGLLPFLKEALNQNDDDGLREKLNLVKNTFLVNHQVGESELYYKMFPSLHLAHSNIGVEFVPTGFKENRSRFIRQISPDERNFYDEVIEVENKDGKYYVEKAGMIEKYERCPDVLKKTLSYSQFVKRYIPSRSVPKKYNFEKDLKGKVSKQMEANGDYIFCADNTKKLLNLPNYIPLQNNKNPGDFQWMKRRTPKVLRYHKFKQKTEAHQYYYSEMQLFLPFSKEEDMFPSDGGKCKSLYIQNKDKIDYVKGKVLPHSKRVEEAREMAENIISDIGDEIDPENQLQEDESELVGVQDHPEHYLKDPTGILEEPKMTAKKNTSEKLN